MNCYVKIAQAAVNISITEWQQSIRNYIDTFISHSYTEEHAEADIARLSAETYENMLKISQIIQDAISRIPDWNNSPVSLNAYTYDRDNAIASETDAEVQVGDDVSWGGGTAFTLFVDGENIHIDDVLEAGDSDFFTEGNTQTDYFSLIQEMRSPGSRTQQGNVLTLFTARPVEDRATFEGSTSIPSNIFLTNDLGRAVGIASDLGSRERRDVWQVRINENNLINTLDTPTAKDYQAVGQENIPVKSIRRIG